MAADDDGPSRAAIGGLVAALLAVPVTGACLLWPRGKPELAPAPHTTEPLVWTRVGEPVLTPVASVASNMDANGNYWPNQEKHDREALEAMRRANAANMKTKQGGRGRMGGGTPIRDPEEEIDELKRRVDELEGRPR